MKEAQSTVLPALLELTSSQLEVALQNATSQLDRLAESVAAFARLGKDVAAHPDATTAALGTRMIAESERAMFAMQFHDQLEQRLRHVRDALGDMHDALSAPVSPESESLLIAIRSRYTMEDERRLFDAMVAHLPGAPRSSVDADSDALRGSVELF